MFGRSKFTLLKSVTAGNPMRFFKRRGIQNRLTYLSITIVFILLCLTISWKYNDASSGRDIVDATPLYSTDLCTIMHENMVAVILVNSAAKDIKKRTLIRSTWANKFLCRSLGISVVFLISNSTDPLLEADIHKETMDFGDILHFSLVESYHLVTEKILAGLKWALRQCPKTSYIIKADDDMFINVFQLSTYLNALNSEETSRHFLCLVWNGLRVQRNIRDKWYVSVQQYPYPTYPTCCSGSTYIMPVGVAKRVVELSTVVTPFWIEDVYITGLIAQKGFLGHKQIGHLFGFVNYRYIDVVEGRIVFAHISRNETKVKTWLWNEVIGFQKSINNSLVVRPETYIVEHVPTLKLDYQEYSDGK